ncbi:hypothetical protein F5050DRAFT_770687 [Lentinula boryana]|uniref:Uncharacterized protein n=1 Tax=Lentinula boryana TaxID=40481 RepID=A0ABQ8QN97_9AGAR|nr:hypothetical protein F5050DRAFT_770687 [Lentinula boryana]
MSGNDLILWLTRHLRSTVKIENNALVAIPNFSPTQFEVLRVKWNRCRRKVPHVIYNGAIFNWVESILLVEPPFEEEKGVFCLELSSAIGSPEFLHCLLKANDLNSNLHAAAPPFGLGFLLSCESFRGELKSSEWLDMILGDVMRELSASNNGESNASVNDLYRDWLRRDRQPREHEHISTVESTRILSRSAETEASAFETSNRKRPEPSADVYELGSASNSTSEPPSKRPRRSSPSAPLAVRSRSGLLQWLSLTTTQIKPDHLNVHHKEIASRKHSNDLNTQNTSKVCTDPEDPSGWVCVGSTSQYPSDTQNIAPQGPMNQGTDSTSPSTRLPEIPLLSSFQLSSYDLEAPTCEEDKTRRSNDGAQIDSSNTVSSTSKSSSFLPLVANAAGKGHVEQSVNSSDRERPSDDSDTEPVDIQAHSKDFGNEASEETLDAAEVDALLKQDESSTFSNTSSAGSIEQSTAELSEPHYQSSQSVYTNDSSSSLAKIETSFFTALSSTSVDSIFSTSPF